MPADERFVTRPFRDGDEEQILDLFARSFHQPRTREHFDWKFRRDPFGNKRISLTFDDAGRLVGHYAAYAVPFRDGERDLMANQIGDTMTDAAVRHIGRGPSSVLGRTALHFYDTFCEGKVAFNYGFNVANIQRFSLKFLRSDRVEPVTYRARGPMRPISRFARWPRGWRLELVTSAGAEFDEFFERVAPAYAFLVRRDAAYVRWRYLERPDARYALVAIRKWGRMAGWIVFRIRDGRFSWGDALFDPRHEEAVEVMLRHVTPSHSFTEIEAWFPPRPAWFDAVLERLGFQTRPEPQELSLMCVPWTMPHASAAMRERLYYAMGDSDLF
jgi:Acetyltransferase (GNAT) domain